MAITITLRGDYGYTPYQLRNSDADIVDASDASWTLANIGSTTNTYPFNVVDNDPDLVILGGTINGLVSQTLDWVDAYVNSAAVRVENAPRVTIQDWRISRPWDGIRLKGASNGFTIDNVWLSDVRDDGVENDDSLGGTIRDSLFDGVFAGISTAGPADGSGNTVTLDGVLMRMESYLARGIVTHQSPFKADTDESNPHFRVIDSIIAVESVNHDGQSRLKVAFSEMTEVKNSYYLNLSDTPLPITYPKIPTGFTILQGQSARDFWANARADWIIEHDSGSGTGGSPPPINAIVGTNSSETLTGTAQADNISGRGGNDRVFGKGGNDILSGGSGGDKFVFDTRADSSNVDQIADFLPGTDRLYLDNSIFTKLGSGSMSSPKLLSNSYFDIDSSAGDSNDYIIYNRQTGALSYDADGSGPGTPVKFVEIGVALNLDNHDFFVV